MPTWINLTSTPVCSLPCFLCSSSSTRTRRVDEDAYGKIVREVNPLASTTQLSAFRESWMTPR